MIPGKLDRAYPSGHSRLFDVITQDEVVVSEYAPDVRPNRERMLERLRIIAALSDAAVIVEAGSRSGSQWLVRQVQELRSPALAFPGPVTAAASAGYLQLIHDGEASLVAGSHDILDAIAPTSDGAV